MRRLPTLLAASLAATLAVAASARAQDAFVRMPVSEIERRLALEPFHVEAHQGTRFEGDRTQRVLLLFDDSAQIAAKWAPAPVGGEEFNNVPRYEIAAYQLQKMFLPESDYVVPPTVARVVPTDEYKSEDGKSVYPTFSEARSVLVVLQYWLFGVTSQDFYDTKRFERDSVYARHLADMNILTYLIRHSDQNQGNFLIATDSAHPRVFSVDNGVAFSSDVSNRGYIWRNLRVKRLPAATVERLRAITPEELDAKLGVLAQFEVRDSLLVPVEPGPNVDPGRGVRRKNGVVQIGLTSSEIDGVEHRIRDVLKKVDKGDITVF